MRQQKAFSLFELLITISIICIIATLAIPNFKNLLRQAENQTLRIQLQRTLAYARSQAMLHGVKVTLCGASKNHQHCASQWRDGILVFTDADGSAAITSPDQILHIITGQAEHGELHWRSSFKESYLQIQPNGLTNGENGTFWYCEHHATAASWAVIVSLTGRARVVNDAVELEKLSCV
jgi:type IV fimbrial biogenesis protein FimT